MPAPISPAQLDADCLLIVQRVETYAPALGSAIRVMYNIGCREGEIMAKDRWTQIDPVTYTMLPQKGNALRVVPAADLPIQYQHWINASTWPGSITSVNNLRRITRAFSNLPPLFCGSKGISSHRFRHNRIKQLYLSGQTVVQIRDYMGLLSSSIVEGYIDSVISA
jgi:hypothetical protein